MKEIALHILDIVQNSIAAGASLVHIGIMENLKDDRLTVSVTDNGRGMDRETAARVYDPYFTSRTTRKVGLGIPLLKHSAEQTAILTLIVRLLEILQVLSAFLQVPTRQLILPAAMLQVMKPMFLIPGKSRRYLMTFQLVKRR